MHPHGLLILAMAAALGVGAAAELSPIIAATKNSDRTALRALLRPGARPSPSVNATQGDGATALHWASYHDDPEAAELLLRAGANVNLADDLGVTPLWNACQNASVTMVRKLLDAGANPNAAILSGETMLMTAARTGSPAVVEQLLAKGTNVNASAVRGQTALMWAVAQHHPAVVEVLLKHGANVHARSDTWSQLWQTDPEQDVHPDYQVTIQLGGNTALLFAAREGELESAKLLVAAGANVNDAAPYGVTATILAAHSGNADLVKFLLDKDANANADGPGYTALHAAILRGHEDVSRVLLAYGANPNAQLRASTPVRRASEDFYFHPAFVGATPFWLAARFGQPAVMRMLAERGADAKFVHRLEHWGPRSKTSDYVREKSGDLTALMAAVGMGRGSGYKQPEPAKREAFALEGVKIAAELGVDINAIDAEGRTALETATGRGYKSVVEFLTSKGAKLDRPARALPREPVSN